MVLRHGEHGALQPITEPSLLYFPRAQPHWLEPQGPVPAELISVAVDLGSCDDNPLLRALPAVLLHPLAQLPQLAPALDLMSAESAAARCGLWRRARPRGRSAGDPVAAVRHRATAGRQRPAARFVRPRLVRVLAAVHAAPDQPWTLPRMASLAHMSRARFAEHFARVMGEPPGDYLTGWRMGLARTLLAQGCRSKGGQRGRLRQRQRIHARSRGAPAAHPPSGYTTAQRAPRRPPRQTLPSPLSLCIPVWFRSTPHEHHRSRPWGLSLRDYGPAPGSHHHSYFQVLVGLRGALDLEVEGVDCAWRLATAVSSHRARGMISESFQGSQCLVLDTADSHWADCPSRALQGTQLWPLAQFLALAVRQNQPLALLHGAALLREAWLHGRTPAHACSTRFRCAAARSTGLPCNAGPCRHCTSLSRSPTWRIACT